MILIFTGKMLVHWSASLLFPFSFLEELKDLDLHKATPSLSACIPVEEDYEGKADQVDVSLTILDGKYGGVCTPVLPLDAKPVLEQSAIVDIKNDTDFSRVWKRAGGARA